MRASKKLYQKLQKQYSKRINLDLKRIKKVLSILHDPQDQLDNVINVIGSDGKNSFLTSLKYFLEADNKKVNTFTSPHLYDVRSRIWLGNRFISLAEIKKYKKYNKVSYKQGVIYMRKFFKTIHILENDTIYNYNQYFQTQIFS